MKKMKVLVALFAAMLVLSSCSSQSKTIDAEKLSEDLLNNVTFQDELTLADDNTAKKLYNVEDFVNAYVYISSGATAEEIAVFEFKDEDSAKQALDNANTRISEQKDSFASYIPEEVKKLDNAVVKQTGCYLIVCVSDGSEAADTISQYVK
ncbi:MAG: DUF4358 domain-containing protein [Oscillospiraceae bacterium]|jgi:hypothetical protein